MFDIVPALLPSDVSATTAGLLVLTSLATSMLTAAFGLGGGLAMLAVLANLLPPFAVIPIHGFIQFGNNVIRTWMYRRHVNGWILVWFSLGALAGGAIGINLAITVSRPVLQLVLGVFVLYSALGKTAVGRPLARGGQVVSGFVTTFATLFVGATGPLVAAVMPRQNMTRDEVVGTHGALMVVQHGLKMALFGIAGFAYAPWLPLLAVIFVTGIAGNMIGRAALERVSEKMFQRIFQLLLALLGARLIVAAVLNWV